MSAAFLLPPYVSLNPNSQEREKRKKGLLKLTIHILLDAFMRQDTAAVDINLIPNRHVVPQHANVLQPRPLANRAVPADNRALDPRVVFDLTARQQHASLQPHAVPNHHVGSDGDVGTDAAVLANPGGRVDEDVAAVDKGSGERRQFLGVLLRE